MNFVLSIFMCHDKVIENITFQVNVTIEHIKITA